MQYLKMRYIKKMKMKLGHVTFFCPSLKDEGTHAFFS